VGVYGVRYDLIERVGFKSIIKYSDKSTRSTDMADGVLCNSTELPYNSVTNFYSSTKRRVNISMRERIYPNPQSILPSFLLYFSYLWVFPTVHN
jgi:hypothetical protein